MNVKDDRTEYEATLGCSPPTILQRQSMNYGRTVVVTKSHAGRLAGTAEAKSIANARELVTEIKLERLALSAWGSADQRRDYPKPNHDTRRRPRVGNCVP